MSDELKKKLEAADRINPGRYRVFRSKLPGLYIRCAKRILWERAIENLQLCKNLK